MKKINRTIFITTLAFVFFIILCQVPQIPFLWLNVYLLGLISLFIYMVLVILKNGSPSKYTFDNRFYEDVDKGPHNG